MNIENMEKIFMKSQLSLKHFEAVKLIVKPLKKR